MPIILELIIKCMNTVFVLGPQVKCFIYYQGVTAARNRDAPFKKNTSFTKPLNESLEPDPENDTDIEEV